jgi:hypothetical protein
MAESIDINYADRKSAPVQRPSPVEALLKNGDVLLVGEGNFTFTVALAAIRGGSWDGIVSTRYEAETDDNPKPQFDKVKKQCIKFCRRNGQSLGIDDDIQRYIDAVERVEPPPMAENWLFGIDATNTPDNMTVEGVVVMFQCPWLPSGNPNKTPATLITSFLKHISTRQNKNDFVLIGITKQFPYVKNYNLEVLLGVKLSRKTDSSGMYDFLGADDTFVKEILKHGYHHQSCHDGTDIHENIISDHVTLIFRRNGAGHDNLSESSSSSDD